ncbi:MAG: CAP domain-containing protein [Chloroflexi bacterium]|nr:CAP domain-containing protein [Chloroflexota bacterium]MDA1146179.1 CAP domain-containing protein [Chloroflexota bacterium]
MQERRDDDPSRGGPTAPSGPRLLRIPIAWLLPALPLAAAVVLLSWPTLPAATGATAEGQPTLARQVDMLSGVFPPDTAPVLDFEGIARRPESADELAQTQDLLVRAREDAARLRQQAAGPEPAPEARPTATAAPTVAPTQVPVATQTPAPTPTPQPAATPPVAAGPPVVDTSGGVALSARESLLLAAMNRARLDAGLSPVTARADLTSVARARSEEMIRLGYFAHFFPGGHSAYELLANAGVTFSAAGENLVQSFGDVQLSVEIGFEALMNSPTHRANILKGAYTRVGVGSYVGEDGTVIITSIFTDR